MEARQRREHVRSKSSGRAGPAASSGRGGARGGGAELGRAASASLAASGSASASLTASELASSASASASAPTPPTGPDAASPATQRLEAAATAAEAADEDEGKGANVEVYGFVAWIVSFFAFGVFLLWAYIPSAVLERIGVTYYPNKYWAIAVPTQLVFTGVFVLVLYWGINLLATNPLDSLNTITDAYARKQASAKSRMRAFEEESSASIAAIEDIPIEVVNELLYRRPRTRPRTPERTPSRPLSAAAAAAPDPALPTTPSWSA